MKKLMLLVALLAVVSCSEDCEYGGDPERRAELLEEIEVLEEQRDNASSETIAETYQKEIDQKQVLLDEEIGECR